MAKDRDWLSRKEASRWLTERGCPVSPRALEQMASNNNARHGPIYYRNGWSNVQYRADDLEVWRARRMIKVGE